MDICRASPPAGSDPFSVSWQRPGLYGACSRPPPPRSGCVSRDDPWLPLTPSPGCLGPELPTSPPPGQGPLLSGADSWCQAFQAPLFLPRPPPRPPGVPCSPCQRPRCEHRLSVKQRPAPSLTAPGHLGLRVQTWPGSPSPSLSQPPCPASISPWGLRVSASASSRGLSGSRWRVLGSALALYHLGGGRPDPVTEGLTQPRAGPCPSDGSSVLFSGGCGGGSPSRRAGRCRPATAGAAGRLLPLRDSADVRLSKLRRQWGTGTPGMLPPAGSQRVGRG